MRGIRAAVSVCVARARAATSRQAATSASAKASSLMCSGRRTSLRIGAGAKALLDRREQRAVGLGIVERLARLVDRRDAAFGDQEAHRAGIAFSFAAMNSPIARHSSAVVRISVTVGLWR